MTSLLESIVNFAMVAVVTICVTKCTINDSNIRHREKMITNELMLKYDDLESVKKIMDDK